MQHHDGVTNIAFFSSFLILSRPACTGSNDSHLLHDTRQLSWHLRRRFVFWLRPRSARREDTPQIPPFAFSLYCVCERSSFHLTSLEVRKIRFFDLLDVWMLVTTASTMTMMRCAYDFDSNSKLYHRLLRCFAIMSCCATRSSMHCYLRWHYFQTAALPSATHLYPMPTCNTQASPTRMGCV
jgi:hypothetical protein